MRMQPFLKAWFPLPDDPDGARFEVQHLRAGEIADIVDQTHKQRFEFIEEIKPGEVEPVLVPKPILEAHKTKEQVLTVVSAIVDWEGVFDEGDNVLPCTTKSKTDLCAKASERDFAALALFIQDCRKELILQQKTSEEKRRGN